jgi:propionyl-CoA synthetase
MTDPYLEAYEHSITDPESFWGEIAQQCHWFRKWDEVLEKSSTLFSWWFMGGMLNTCYNALDYHVERGLGGKTALIYDSPMTGVIRKYTYQQLLEMVSICAGALISQGVRKGDRVVIYMPMIPEAAISMLACARIGAIHCVISGGISAQALASRIDDTQSKVILSASCGMMDDRIVTFKPILDEAIEIAEYRPQRCIILQRSMAKAALEMGRDMDWHAVMENADPVGCVPVPATFPLYILYTPSTCGRPKGIVRDNGGHMVALKWSMKAIYDIEENDVWWAAADIGWAVGHSYIVYAPLFKGCTTLMYEGRPVGTPDAGAFWRVISDHSVSAMFAAPAACRAIKREDPKGKLLKKYDLTSLRALFLAGERSDPDTLQWAERHLKIPVIDHWWQTEAGWAMAANCMGLHPYPVKSGSTAKPVPGWHLKVVDHDGRPVAPGQSGALVVKLPLPPGSLPTLWQDDQRFVDAYMKDYPGYYKTADAGFIDAQGYVYITARSDDNRNRAVSTFSPGDGQKHLGTKRGWAWA